MKIVAIKALKDNYIWAIVKNDLCLIIDPGEALGVEQFLADNQLILAGILVTHHHPDHTAGILALSKKHKMPIYGHYKSPCKLINKAIDTELAFYFKPMDLTITPIMTPGHTLCHITFLIQKMAFVGDTLFSAGCGKIFEGTAQMMYSSLTKIAALPDETLIYCAHEYTLNNLKFAQLVEPNNNAIINHIDWAKKQQQLNLPTIPTSLATEKTINPFLRCKNSTIKLATTSFAKREMKSPKDIFAILRQWKNKI